MKNSFILAKRNLLESILDPVSIIFCLIFPISMLVLMELIFNSLSTPVMIFEIERFAPGIASFGFTFIMLFTAITVSKDRSESFIKRIIISPVKNFEYLLSYVISDLILSLVQVLVFYAFALIFGLKLNINIIISIIYLIPDILFFSTLGILIGVIVGSEKQSGPVCSIFISLSTMLGGVFMPVEEIGGTFFNICKYLPFYAGINPSRFAILGEYNKVFPDLIIVVLFVGLFIILADLIFKRKIKA